MQVRFLPGSRFREFKYLSGSPDAFRADCTGLFANSPERSTCSSPLSSGRLLDSHDALAERLLQRIATPCPSGSSPERISIFPAQLDSFRADSQGLYATSLSESLARPSFTVRTKEPADVFPRRARLGPPRIITCFASAPAGDARWIQVQSGKPFGDMGPWWTGRA